MHYLFSFSYTPIKLSSVCVAARVFHKVQFSSLTLNECCLYWGGGARIINNAGYATHWFIYSVSQKKSPLGFSGIFFPNGWEFFDQVSRAYYTFLSTLYYNFLFNYLQLWRSYAARPRSSHHMRKMFTIGQNVCWHLLPFFPNSWEFLVQVLHAYYTLQSTLE